MGQTCSGASCNKEAEETEIRTREFDQGTVFDSTKVQYDEKAKTAAVKMQSAFRGRQTRQNLKTGKFAEEMLVQDDELEVVEDMVCEEDGTVYQGQVKKDTEIKHGYGEQVQPEGSRYCGMWEDNRQNGKGRVVHIDGDVYDGQWKEGKATGYGIYKCSDNITKYEGFWLNDDWEDFGVHERADGQTYTGQMKVGQMDGFGEFMFTDKSRYVGDYRENEINGYGATIQPDETCFVGNWQNSTKQGLGTYVWVSGRAYHGDYQNDLKDGQGVYFFDDGRAYVGGWSNGQQHGIGFTVFPNQKIIKQNFEAGKRKERLNAEPAETETVQATLEAARKAVAEVPAIVAQQQQRLDDLKNEFEDRKPVEHRTLKQENEEIELQDQSARSTPQKSISESANNSASSLKEQPAQLSAEKVVEVEKQEVAEPVIEQQIQAEDLKALIADEIVRQNKQVVEEAEATPDVEVAAVSPVKEGSAQKEAQIVEEIIAPVEATAGAEAPVAEPIVEEAPKEISEVVLSPAKVEEVPVPQAQEEKVVQNE